jgi:hypothetical protein
MPGRVGSVIENDVPEPLVLIETVPWIAPLPVPSATSS